MGLHFFNHEPRDAKKVKLLLMVGIKNKLFAYCYQGRILMEIRRLEVTHIT